MATGSDTKATQTEEEVEDYLHLREENINFKCAEGIPAKLLKFRAFHEKGFRVRIELNGRLYRGAFLEVNDTHSFAPVNLITTKRRRPVIYKKNKTRPSGVTRNKNPNTFCRENFPRCFVDAYNTIDARLRYGRDKKTPGFNSFLSPADSSSQFKDDSVLKSNRKKKSHSVAAGSASNTESSISSVKSNRKKKSFNVVAGSTSNMDSSISSAKSNRKKRSWSVVAGLTSNMDSSISSEKSNRKLRERDVIMISASNMDSSISSSKSNRKKKSRSVTVSNSDSSITSVTKHKNKRKYCKRNESENASETSNESSPPPLLIFYPKKNNREKSEISSDTSFSSVSEMTSKKDEKQTNYKFLWAMQSQPPDLNSGPGCMVSTPRTDTNALSMNIDDTLRSEASNSSLSRMSEFDLITFSPEIDAEKQCRKGHPSVESVSTSPQLSEPDLICFSPEINNETNLKTKVPERPSIIKNIALDLLFGTRSEDSCTTNETVSFQFSHKELVYKPDKIDAQFIENGNNIFNRNKKSVNQSTKSKLQNSRGLKDGPINNILNKITTNKGNNSSELKPQYKSNFIEIQGTNSSLKIKTLNEVNQREKCSESHGEMIGVKSNIYSDRKFNLEFESAEKNNTADQKSKQIFARGITMSNQYISQNNRKVEGIHSKENTVIKIVPSKLPESRFPKNSEIQCTNDNFGLKEIACQFPVQVSSKRETSSDSKNKEN